MGPEPNETDPSGPVPTVTEPATPIPTGPAVPGRSPTCGIDWNNERAEVPSEPGLVGTVNGRPFALPLERVHAELDCDGTTGQPPALHLGFALEAEGLVFVIRRCDGIAYLPDSTGIALETDPEKTLGTVASELGQPSGGRFRLTGRATPESEPIELEFSLSVPLVGATDPVPVCPG